MKYDLHSISDSSFLSVSFSPFLPLSLSILPTFLYSRFFFFLSFFFLLALDFCSFLLSFTFFLSFFFECVCVYSHFPLHLRAHRSIFLSFFFFVSLPSPPIEL